MPRLSGFAGPALLAISSVAALVVTLAITPDVDPIAPTLAMLVAALGAAACAGGILVAGLRLDPRSADVARSLRVATGGAIAWAVGALVVAALTVRAEWAVSAAVAATAVVLCAAVRHPAALAAVALAALLVPAVVAGQELAPGLLDVADPSALVVAASVLLSAGAGVSLARAVAARETDTARVPAAMSLVALVVQGAGLGILVALVQLAEDIPGVDASRATPAEYLTGRALPPALTPASALGEWRIDAVALVLLLVGAICAARGIVRLRRAGSWHPLRTVPLVLAFAVLLWATCGAPAVYAPTLFSMHALQLVLLLAVAPALLVLASTGRVLVAAVDPRGDGSRGPREWGAALTASRSFGVVTHPMLLGALAAVLPWAVTFTPMLRWSVEHAVVGGALEVSALLLGCGVVAAIAGRSLGTEVRASTRLTIALLIVASWVVAAIVLASGSGLLAADWFGAMGWPGGADPVSDQRLGGSAAWTLAAIALLPALGAAIVATARRGAEHVEPRGSRESAQELAAYDAILARRGADAAPDQ